MTVLMWFINASRCCKAIEVQLIISFWAVVGKNLGLKATPKYVAQKKAFFKAHYKKTAAMSAEVELLDQERAS